MRISFKHDLHSKQIVKIGMTKGKQPRPIYMFRFFACQNYNKRFKDIVKTEVSKNSYEKSRCIHNHCDWCAGEVKTHVYIDESFDDTLKFHSGTRALDIPDVKTEDILEIMKLVDKEHGYFALK